MSFAEQVMLMTIRRVKYREIRSDDEMKRIRKKEKDRYDGYYFRTVYWHEDFPHDPDHKKRFSFLARLLLESFNFRVFLDVGCGMGHLLKEFVRHDIQVFGVEASWWAVKHPLAQLLRDLKPMVVIRECETRALPFESNSFDMVLCTDVLEHIPIFDVDSSIIELARVSKRHLVITINLDHIYEYHPTLLPRAEWQKKFDIPGLRRDEKKENLLSRKCKNFYPEYDFFIFDKLPVG